jgi:hypothetical protein
MIQTRRARWTKGQYAWTISSHFYHRSDFNQGSPLDGLTNAFYSVLSAAQQVENSPSRSFFSVHCLIKQDGRRLEERILCAER